MRAGDLPELRDYAGRGNGDAGTCASGSVMRWFGPPRRREPDASGFEQIAAPVGVACAWCNEPIEICDSGVTMPCICSDGVREEIAFHFECHARQVIGSVAHIQRRCSCFVAGSTCNDPPEMTKRQAARAALDLI